MIARSAENVKKWITPNSQKNTALVFIAEAGLAPQIPINAGHGNR
jgi:hypothetical protein